MTEDRARSIGRYSFHEPIAKGGMAAVHFGTYRGAAGFSRIVAIKRLRAELGSEPSFAGMLLDEARVSSRIQHPNVVSTLDVVAQGDELFMVLEYVHGESLSRLVRAENDRQHRVPPAIAVAIIIDVLRGLHAAHEARGVDGTPLEIVHRDVSPQNVIVDVNGTARVLDFGVAKARQREQSTQTGQLKGKLRYMAPEQVHGQTSRRSDLFSAGVVLWETLTGEPLFRGENEGETIAKVLGSRIPKLRERDVQVPDALEEVLARLLDRRPEARFATAQEALEALGASLPAARAEEVARWVQDLAPDSLAARAARCRELERGGSDADETVTAASAPSAAARPRWIAPLGAGLIGSLAFAAWLVLRSSSGSSAPVATASAVPDATPAPSLDLSASPILADAGAESAAPGTSITAPSAAASGAASAAARPRPTPSVPKAPRDRCNPPYTFDAHGVKVYKRECFSGNR